MYGNLKCHGNFLLVNHYVTDTKHGRQIAAQVDDAAVSAGKGHQ